MENKTEYNKKLSQLFKSKNNKKKIGKNIFQNYLAL